MNSYVRGAASGRAVANSRSILSSGHAAKASLVLAVLQLLVVVAMVGASLYVIAVSSWTTLFSDQWRIYDTYFSVPFPKNVLISQNGHHPVLPGLLFLADIHLAGARNYLINTVGILLAVMLCFCWCGAIWRDQELEKATKLLAIGLVWTLTFWMGNLRVLVHGNESLHVYPVLLAILLIAAVLSGDAHRPSRRLRFGVAGLAGIIAMFSFGFGTLAWIVAILIAWMSARDFRLSATLAALSVAAFALYIFGLPGRGSQHRGLSFEPLRILADASTWLGAPLVRALEAFPTITERVDSLMLSALLGGVGLASAIYITFRRLWSYRVSSRLEAMTVATLTFGAGCSFLVAIARGKYFAEFAGQVMAPRYLPWSCAFWLGLLIFAALSLNRHAGSTQWLLRSWMLTAAVFPLIFLASHKGWNYEFKKHRSAEAAEGLLVGARDDKKVIENLFPRPEVVYRVGEVLARHGWGVYASPLASYLRLEIDQLFPVKDSLPIPAAMNPRIEPVPTASGGTGARVSAVVARSVEAHLSREILIADGAQSVVGVGYLRGGGHHFARKIGILPPTASAFSIYVAPYSPIETYTVFAVDRERTSVLAILSFGPESEGVQLGDPLVVR